MWRLADLRRFSALPRLDRRRVGRAMLRLLCIDFGIRLFGFSSVSGWLDRRRAGRAAVPPRGEATLVAAWTRAMDLAARHHLYAMPCLPRALAFRSFLRDEGIEVELRIGVRKEGESLAAHAWVEHRGVPVGESPSVLDRFAPLPPLDRGGSGKAEGDAFC